VTPDGGQRNVTVRDEILGLEDQIGRSIIGQATSNLDIHYLSKIVDVQFVAR
jgi:hypothetical protein